MRRTPKPAAGVACVGAAAIDRRFQAAAAITLGTSNPASGATGFGGVARNVAETLARLGVPTRFFGAVGDDENGRAVLRHLRSCGVDTGQVVVAAGQRTAEYVAIHEADGSLFVGVSDMAALDRYGPEDLERSWPHLAAAAWIFADCNLPAETIATLARRRRPNDFRLAIDAVSTTKARRLPRDLSGIDALFLNRDEASALLDAAPDTDPAHMAQALHGRGAARVLLTLGADGGTGLGPQGRFRWPAVPASVVDVTGAGDAFAAGTLARLTAGADLPAAARHGALLAAMTLEIEASVRQDLSADLVARTLTRAASASPAGGPSP